MLSQFVRRPDSLGRVALGCLWILAGAGATNSPVRADAFSNYARTGRSYLPAGAGPFDALPDGRIITTVDEAVWVESGAGTGVYISIGLLPGADFPSFGPAFVRVSPDGTKIAVGNNGGDSFADFRVGIFAFPSLTGAWFSAAHYDGEWLDATHIGLTAGAVGNPSVITVLDATSPVPTNPINPVIIDGIGGASAGIALDAVGNLFSGNGFRTTGPSSTGTIKMFLLADWTGVMASGPPLDFESEGVLIIDILSASPLGFDTEGNMFVGGGDFADANHYDYAALVSASAVAAAAGGGGPIDPSPSATVRRFDPVTDADFNFYYATHNAFTGELLVRDGSTNIVDHYRDITDIPTVSGWGALVLVILLMTGGSIVTAPSFRPRMYRQIPGNSRSRRE